MSDKAKTAIYFSLLVVFIGLPMGKLIYNYGQQDKAAVVEQFETNNTPTDSVTLYIDAGLNHYQNGNYFESLKLWAKADQLSPNNPVILSNVASALIQIGQPKDAIPLLEKAIKIDPTNQLYKNNLKWAYDELQATMPQQFCIYYYPFYS